MTFTLPVGRYDHLFNSSLDFCLRVVALFDHKGVLTDLVATGWGVENIQGFKKEISRLLPP